MEIKNIQIVVKETDLGVGNMIDDHAISINETVLRLKIIS